MSQWWKGKAQAQYERAGEGQGENDAIAEGKHGCSADATQRGDHAAKKECAKGDCDRRRDVAPSRRSNEPDE